jgi:hypothetical protein
MHEALAATATLLSVAFAMFTYERWLGRHRRHELMWTIALVMFALGSFGLWLGAALGWSEWSFKVFFLFGAILNVPFLALGTVYLLGGQRRGDVATAMVSLLGAFAAGIVVAAPLIHPISGSTLPQGSAVFAIGPRIAAGVGSGVAATVIFVGAIWSAVRLLAGQRRSRAADDPTIGAGRLAAANLVIAAGTLILSAGGILNATVDAMNAFSVSLVVGIAVIFAGFLLAASPASVPSGEPEVRGSLGAGPVPSAQGTPQELSGQVVR